MRFAAYCFLPAICALGIGNGADALPREISPEMPLFLFDAPGAEAADGTAQAEAVLAAWQGLPDDLRPYAAMVVRSTPDALPLRVERFRTLLIDLQAAGVPVFMEIADGAPGRFLALEAVERILREFSIVQGLHVEGLTFGEYYEFGQHDSLGTPPQVRWLSAVVETAARHDRFVSIELGGLHWLRLMANAWTSSLYDTIRANAGRVIALNDQRGTGNIARSSALMGLWLEGTVGQWGVTSSSDWYRAAHFAGPGVFSARDLGAPMPPAIYRAMVLNGAMTGAAAYRFSRPDDLWYGPRRHNWDQAIAPVLREILRSGLVARKDLVQRKARVAYRLDRAETVAEFHRNLMDADAASDQGNLIRGVYGLERAGQIPELVPNTGRYYWLPILSPYAAEETLREFSEVILPGAIVDAPSWTRRVAPYYEPDGEGTAFISRVGRGFFVLHTRENLFEQQTFRIDNVPRPVRALRAQRTGRSVELTWPFREGDFSYRVQRRILPEIAYTTLARDLDGRSYMDSDIEPSAIVAYAVTALTNEHEPYEGTVNFGDYRVISAVESRVAEEALLDSYATVSTVRPVIEPPDSRPETQRWWPNLDGYTGAEKEVGEALAARIEAWEAAFVAEDLPSIMQLYAVDYEDDAGNDRGGVRGAYEAFFTLYEARGMHRQIRTWDFTEYFSKRRITVLMYCRFTGLDRSDAAIAIPDAEGSEVRITFVNRDEAWRIVRTEPALPTLNGVLRAAGEG